MLDGFVNSGAITTLILAIMVVEALCCIFYFRQLRPMLATLAAGACLALALRAALLGHGPTAIASWLGLGFVFHVLEVWQWIKMSKRQPQ
jgi:hypothetical protein